MTTSGNGPFATSARASAIGGAAAKKPSAATGALSAERRAAAVAAGVVLRSADDRTALFTQWLAPHLPMVRGLVRRHTYFAGERADDYQTAVLHLLEHLDDLAHFALCLTARRDTAKPHAATANDPAPADEPSAQPTTPVACNFDETRAAVDESEVYLDEHAPYLYASAAESNESQCGSDETRPASDETLREVNKTRPSADEDLRAIDAAAVAFDAVTDADDEPLREVDETRSDTDEDLRTIDAAAENFDAMTDADNESLREVDETAVAFDETAAADEASAAGADERQPYADAALEGAERTRVPLSVTAEEVLRTVGPFNPRPWLAGVTLRLLSTLNHRALRHRETHLTPASADSDELFDPVDPDGGLWAVGANPATVGAQEHAAPSRWEETLGAGREHTRRRGDTGCAGGGSALSDSGFALSDRGFRCAACGHGGGDSNRGCAHGGGRVGGPRSGQLPGMLAPRTAASGFPPHARRPTVERHAGTGATGAFGLRLPGGAACRRRGGPRRPAAARPRPRAADGRRVDGGGNRVGGGGFAHGGAPNGVPRADAPAALAPGLDSSHARDARTIKKTYAFFGRKIWWSRFFCRNSRCVLPYLFKRGTPTR